MDSNLSRMPRMDKTQRLQFKPKKATCGKNAKNIIVQSRKQDQNAKYARGKNFRNAKNAKIAKDAKNGKRKECKV